MSKKKLDELTGESVSKGVSGGGGGGTMLTGDGIELYKLMTLRQALKLHKLGIRMTSRGPAATTVARKHYGMKGNIDSLIEQVDAVLSRLAEERDRYHEQQRDAVYDEAIQMRIDAGGEHDA